MYLACFSLSQFIKLVTGEILKGFFKSIQGKKPSKNEAKASQGIGEKGRLSALSQGFMQEK